VAQPQAKVRSFLALELDAEMRARVVDCIALLAGRIVGARWLGAAQLHLTLRFLGDVSERQVAEIVRTLPNAVSCDHPIDAQVGGLGLFPERGSPRVLWIGMRLPPAGSALQARCEALARQVGLAAERRPFQPHITLARWRERSPRPPLPPIDLGPTRLNRLVLYRSDLAPSGARHTALSTVTLAPGQEGA
jgi:RNA 2',3'-cyclic 3'-phosphodiesterase